MSERREIRYNFIFTAIPAILLKAHDLLNKNDRDLLAQIICAGPNGCFMTVDRLTEKILGCGEPAFYRSVYKLKHLRLISFRRGNKTKANLYKFESDCQKWRLTADMHRQLVEHAKKCNIDNFQMQTEPFPNLFGFITSYNSVYASHPLEFPKKKNFSEPEPIHALSDPMNSTSKTEATPIKDVQFTESRLWQNRIEQMEKNNSFYYVIRNINYFSKAVEQYKAWKEGVLTEYSACSLEKKYISTLIQKYEVILKHPFSDFESQCFEIMRKCIEGGYSGEQTEREIRLFKIEYDKQLENEKLNSKTTHD